MPNRTVDQMDQGKEHSPAVETWDEIIQGGDLPLNDPPDDPGTGDREQDRIDDDPDF